MLSVDHISAFYGDMQALRDVSMTVESGEIVSVIGSNGAGKSTLLKAISGIIRSKKGNIIFDNTDITKRPSATIVAGGISHVPEGRQVFPTMTVLENLEMGAQFPDARKARSETLKEVFSFFPRLKERLNQPAGTLSGGEQQMLAMGRGLMSLPKLMMLDEPSLGLSPLLVSTIFEIIGKIHQMGTAILLIEQNVYQSLAISSRGYVLENGAIALSGPSDQLLNHSHIRKTYLGL